MTQRQLSLANGTVDVEEGSEMSDQQQYPPADRALSAPAVLAIIAAGVFLGALAVFLLLSDVGENVLNNVLP